MTIQTKALGRRMKLLSYTLVAALTIAGSTFVAAPKAEAATGCVDGDRAFAASLASSGDFVDAGVTNIVGGKISLRYSSETGCAWGLISDLGQAAEVGGMWGYIWLDRSTDGGRTWQGKLGNR